MATSRRVGRPEAGRKSEVVTVRLDPKLKYLAELAARRQRRPLSSYIEWAIEQSLAYVVPHHDPNHPEFDQLTLADKASDLWDVDEPDRFVKLALDYPDLLDHEEQIRWKLVRENGLLWRGNYRGGEWVWNVSRDALIWERLREHWETFCKVAQGELPHSALPDWKKVKASDSPPRRTDFPGDTPRPDLDDEIPF